MTTYSRAKILGAASALLASVPLTDRIAAAARPDTGDADVLNSVLRLERACVAAYTSATGTSVLSATVSSVLKSFMADHAAHLDALSAAVTQAGGTPAADAAALPGTPSLDNETNILSSAYDIERFVANAYLNALPQFKNRDLAKTAGSILGVDTGHVALLAEALRRNPAYPTSFVTP